MPSASANTRKLNLAFVAELIAEGATEATLPTALAKIRDRYPVVPGGDKAANKLHSTRRQQVAVQLILALKIEDRYKLGALYPEFSSFLPKLLKAKTAVAVAEGSNNNSPEPAPAHVAAATATPMSPEEAYLRRTEFPSKVLEELAEQYKFKEIVAIATGRHIQITQKDDQRTYARLALAYESAADMEEKEDILEDIYDLLMEIARKAIFKEWNSYKITSMFSLKFIIERRLKLTGLPSVEGEYDSIILVEPLMTSAICKELAELEIDYTIANATSQDTAPIVKEIHEFFMRLYEEAVPAYKKRRRSERRREKYADPQVDNSTLKKVNAVYTKRPFQPIRSDDVVKGVEKSMGIHR
jgi:hypothetical protein